MQWPDTVIKHLPEILAVFVAVAGGIRWLLQWRAKRYDEKIKHLDMVRKEAPDILNASIDSMQDFIDFYDTVLQDCKGNLKDCLKQNADLRARLHNLMTHPPDEAQEE